MKKAKFYNRQLIVNKKLQYTIMFHSIALAVWLTVLNIALFAFIAVRGVPQSSMTLSAYLPIFLFIVVGTAITSGLFISNRIAGPIFRLQRHLEGIAAGEKVEELKFRNADYFSEILIPYNKVIQKIQKTELDPIAKA